MISTLPLPEFEYLRECFSYDGSGFLVWNQRPLSHFKNAHGMNTFNAKFSGKMAQNMVNKRYFSISVNGRAYLVHRIIWKLLTGSDPSGNIDHIDTNKINNRIENLRIADKQQNAFNCAKSSRNSTGYKGVSYDKLRGKFYACIRKDGKTKSLGRFNSADMAAAAYISAASEFHGEFMRMQA